MVITEIWQDRHRNVQNSHTLRMGRDWPLKPTIRESTPFVDTSAFHRTNVEFGKHWSLSTVA